MENNSIAPITDEWVNDTEPKLAYLGNLIHLNAHTRTRKSITAPVDPTPIPSSIEHYIATNRPDTSRVVIVDRFEAGLAKKNTTYLLNHSLETAHDPSLMLRELRRALKSDSESCAYIISTNPAIAGTTQNKLPKNTSHYREWTPERLSQLLITLGFTIEEVLVAETKLFVNKITATEVAHTQTLQRLSLPNPKTSLIVTTEHADTKSTGGIGSYVKEVEQVMGDEKPMILVVSAEPFKTITTTNEIADNIIDIHTLLYKPAASTHTTDWNSASISVYHAVKTLTVLYDQLTMVEYQEYQGIGARLAQAKKIHEIPSSVTLVARCHGSQVYIDRASYSWSGMEKADEFELERLSVELADEVSIPTQYLKDLYTSTGYNIKDENSYVLRLPYLYPHAPRPNFKQATQLVFLGKRSEMKGFPSFFEVVKEITDKHSPNYNPSISSIHVIAAPGDASDPYDDLLKKLAETRGLKLTIGPLPRHKVLTTLQDAAANSIVCLPYGGDNHPVTILEMVANYCRFVAYHNGGIPELIPERYRNNFICAPNPQDMTKKVNQLALIPLPEATALTDKLHSAALSEQAKINDQIRQSYLRSANTYLQKSVNLEGLASVIVPIYNTDLKYVNTVIECLNRQTLQPAEVLFVNDCSPNEGYKEKLHKLINSKSKTAYSIIDHEVNLGLAGARNTGLAHCKSKYLINLDSDDVVSDDFILDYVRFMEENPSYSAVSCALESFTDRDGWNRRPINADYAYVGVGSCFILGVSKNIFGHAGACVKVDDARKLGGWDASDRSKWEDWAFFLKMTSSGMRIFNFPKTNYYYRVSPDSMVRTYANYPAEMRIARNINGLSIWESHRLYAFIKDEASRSGTKATAEPDTLTYRVAKRTTQAINKVPIIKKVAKKVIITSWGVVKLIKNT